MDREKTFFDVHKNYKVKQQKNDLETSTKSTLNETSKLLGILDYGTKTCLLQTHCGKSAGIIHYPVSKQPQRQKIRIQEPVIRVDAANFQVAEFSVAKRTIIDKMIEASISENVS